MTWHMVILDLPDAIADKVRVRFLQQAVMVSRNDHEHTAEGRRTFRSLTDIIVHSIDQLGLQLHAMEAENRPSRICVVIFSDERNRYSHHTTECANRRILHQQYVYSWEFKYVSVDSQTNGIGRALGIVDPKEIAAEELDATVNEIKTWAGIE